MGIRFACHVCNKKLNIKRELAGRRGVCPECSAKFRIPLDDAETSTPVEQLRRIQTPHTEVAETSAAMSEPDGDPVGIALSDEDPDATWYVRPPNGGQYGPASSEVLKQWVAEGRVAATALLWRDGWPQWRDANKVLPELAGPLPAGTTPTNSQSATGITTESLAESTATPGGSVFQRPRVRQRLRLIGILAVLSIALVGVLIFVMIRG